MPPILIFQFHPASDLSNWRIVDDVVMGGKSTSSFSLNPEGHGEFSGNISLDNNGGFSSVHYSTGKIKVHSNRKIKLRVRGDGNIYQFRIKEKLTDRHSYLASFRASTDWQEVEIPFDNFYPGFRGRKLEMPNFAGESLEGIAFLIASKNPGPFRLEISRIELQ